MADDSNKFPSMFITFVFFSCLFSQAFSSSCPDGSYKHDGRDCCLCGAGLHLEEHCKTNLTHGKCVPCGTGTYTSNPNDQTACDRCTSCSHPNVNLEVAEPCTSARDTKCRCEKDHYCVLRDKGVCSLCHPCNKCGAEGIKVACTDNSNTVCNEKSEGGNQTGLIAGIIVMVLIILVGGALFLLWKKKKRQSHHLVNGNPIDVVIPPPSPDVDLEPLLPDIAKAVGWTVMQDVALRTGITRTTIESAQLDHPGHSELQTLRLLTTWVESQGKQAGVKLIETLRNTGKKAQAEKVTNILSRGN